MAFEAKGRVDLVKIGGQAFEGLGETPRQLLECVVVLLLVNEDDAERVLSLAEALLLLYSEPRGLFCFAEAAFVRGIRAKCDVDGRHKQVGVGVVFVKLCSFFGVCEGCA